MALPPWETDYMCSKKVGGRGLVFIDDSIDTSIQFGDIRKSIEALITAAIKSSDNIGTYWTITKNRKRKWEEKQLHGYFKRETDEISQKKK